MKNKVKVYRAMHGLTQDSLAAKLQVTRQTIISIEKEKYDPSLELAFKMARLFDVKIEDIFDYDGTGEDKHVKKAKL
jgi:putative transcriptional regulator